jgi:tetratricopeptide (TPR) repeat protein
MLTDLATTPLGETLWRLASERKSGDLQVTSGKVVKTVFLDHGRVVFAASNLKRDRLGESLVAVGKITDQQYQQATQLIRGPRPPRFGEALVQAGILDKQEVGRSVARQVGRIVVSLFPYTEGASLFEERKCVIPLEYMVSLSLHRLLLEGIRGMKSEDLVLKGLGQLDRRVSLPEAAPFNFEPRHATETERDILEQARRKVTLRKLAWEEGGLSFARLRSVYALLRGGLLEEEAPSAAGGVRAPSMQMETGTFLLSVLRNRPDPSAREAIRQEVDEELKRSARLDRETWLKVSREAPRAELLRAIEDKMERYRSLLDAAGGEEDLKTDIETIIGRAYALRRLVEEVPPAPLPAPAAVAAPGAAEPHPAPDSVAAPVGAPPASVAELERVAGVQAGMGIDIDHLLMEAHVRMTVGDYANAIRVYQKLVDAEPQNASFHAKLAIAMAAFPRTVKQAEREFLEAVRLDADNAEIHYQFGLFYQIMKQRARALAELQAAVRLNPRHKQAQEALKALGQRSSGFLNLKKLFS